MDDSILHELHHDCSLWISKKHDKINVENIKIKFGLNHKIGKSVLIECKSVFFIITSFPS